jgi:hypothetical protein
MATALDLITDALTDLNIIDPLGTVDATTANHALRVMNRMLDDWSTEAMSIFTENRNAYPLTSTVQTYTLGPAGTLTATRPVRITRASVIPAGTSPELEIPIQVMTTTEEWQGVTLKQVNSVFPVAIYVDGNSPLETIWTWPVPTTACQIVLYTYGELTNLTLNQSITFPKGYEGAIVANLAVRLGVSYGKQPDPVMIELANNGKRRIAEINYEPAYMGTDNALVQRNGWNLAVRSRGLVVDP